MKHLVSLAFVLAASSQLAGCIIVDDSGDDVSTRLDVTWQLKSGNTNATCRPDTAAATLWVCPGDCTNLNDAKGDVFTCTAGGGSVPAGGDPALAYPPGRYAAWMEFSTNSKQVYAKSFSQTVNLDAGGLTTARFDVQVDHGFFDMAWMLTKGAQVLPCPSSSSRVGLIVNATGVDTVDSQWACADGAGRSNPVPNSAQGFVWKADLLDSSAASKDFNASPFAFGNEAKDLGTVVIEVP